MDETKKPVQHGEKPLKNSRFAPGKIDPASSPVQIFKDLYRPAR